MPRIRNPILSLRALVGVPDDAAATYAVTLGFPFDLTGRRSLRSSEADILAEEAEAQIELERIEARARATTATARVYAGQELVQIAESRVRLAVSLREATQARVDAGAATALDAMLAAQELGRAGAMLEASRRELEAARDALREVLDLGPLAPVRVEALGLPQMPPGLSLARAVEIAADQRREPRLLRLAARRLEVTEDRLFAESVSPLTISAEYEVQTNSQRLSSFGVGASMELPLAWTAQGDRAVARSSAVASAGRAELVQRSAARDAATAWRALTGTLAELRTLEQEALPATERALEATEELLARGAVDSFRLLLARRELFELRARRAELVLAAWVAHAELERAVGGEL